MTGRRYVLLLFFVAIAVVVGQLAVVRWASRPSVGCWEAPREALEQQRTDVVVADSYWLRSGDEPPVYCVRWMSADFAALGRVKLADRCWPARALSAEECAKSPAVSP